MGKMPKPQIRGHLDSQNGCGTISASDSRVKMPGDLFPQPIRESKRSRIFCRVHFESRDGCGFFAAVDSRIVTPAKNFPHPIRDSKRSKIFFREHFESCDGHGNRDEAILRVGMPMFFRSEGILRVLETRDCRQRTRDKPVHSTTKRPFQIFQSADLPAVTG